MEAITIHPMEQVGIIISSTTKSIKQQITLGIRDYIHVMDLATGHVAALDMLCRKHQRLKASVTGMSFTSLLFSFQKFNVLNIFADFYHVLGIQFGNWTRRLRFTIG